ncbi:MAG: glycyl radical protein [Alphaproteobacteria bacterium]|nr:glycyl radical protein [Alphaproteobacteria bacterium]MDE2072325.1 glycyl radical protein [Alphaproteobacteria bacterium]
MNAPVRIEALSAQEVALLEGRRAVRDNVSERVLRLFERVRTCGQPRVSLERAVLFTESIRTTEGQPMPLRWAKALRHIAENITVSIFEDELIVGRPNDWFGKYGIIYPELDGSLMQPAVAAFRAHQGFPDSVTITEEDERIINEVLAPYWNGRDFATNFARALPEPSRFITFGPDPRNVAQQTGVVFASQGYRHSQNWTPDHAKLLRGGLKAIREEAKARLVALKHPLDTVEKKPFLEAVIVTCDALAIWARRYAELAGKMADKESDAARRRELAEIAEICAWVPENPARSFREALQAQWFSQCFSRLEEMIGGDVCQGRMDQYLYPYYRKDVDEGRLTRDAAEELFQCLWLNMSQNLQIMLSPTAAAGREGFSHHETVTIGGRTPEGEDATNELSYVLLESTRPLRMSYPELAARIHAGTPERFLHAVAEAIKDGKGSPKIINDEFLVPFYLSHGVSHREALDYAVSGCIESRLINRETHKTGGSAINYGSVLEMALRQGRVKILGDLRFGLETGDPRSFASYDELWAAFKSQLENVIAHIMAQGAVARTLKPRHFAAPYASMLHDLAMDACMDLQRHGEGIPGGLDLCTVDGVGGFGTAIDSLAAIKHLIFDEKKLTWDQLLGAMEHNWEGGEIVRQMCLNAPKYGNGIEWVDAIGHAIHKTALDYLRAHPRPNGLGTILRIIPITFHVPAGRVTSATPNGRVAGEYLSEGISPCHGMDVEGPTVSLTSMARATSSACREKGHNLINMKFSPANLAGEAGTRRLMQFIRSWCRERLSHLQFNIINRETLLAAQKDPEKYRDLVVRIAGYCAYFVELTAMQQAEIIARTEEQS